MCPIKVDENARNPAANWIRLFKQCSLKTPNLCILLSRIGALLLMGISIRN